MNLLSYKTSPDYHPLWDLKYELRIVGCFRGALAKTHRLPDCLTVMGNGGVFISASTEDSFIRQCESCGLEYIMPDRECMGYIHPSCDNCRIKRGQPICDSCVSMPAPTYQQVLTI